MRGVTTTVVGLATAGQAGQRLSWPTGPFSGQHCEGAIRTWTKRHIHDIADLIEGCETSALRDRGQSTPGLAQSLAPAKAKPHGVGKHRQDGRKAARKLELTHGHCRTFRRVLTNDDPRA